MSELSGAPAGFTWGDYLATLVAKEGSLTAVAEKLAAVRSYTDDVASIEKALRRLRLRELRPGGKWGTRLVSLFGLPHSVEARLRWMAAYHSRFTDLPVPVCDDLIRLWDHPPTTERRENRAFLALARASIALRRNDASLATSRLRELDLLGDGLPLEVRIEALLMKGFIASKDDPNAVPALLSAVGPLLSLLPMSDDRACLEARYTDQRAYELNRQGEHAAAEALYRGLTAADTSAFVACRRANGLAYALWKQGRSKEAADFAREALRHSGDGGHVRLRVMALSLLARIDPAERQARERALAISRRLEDETLLLRLGHSVAVGDVGNVGVANPGPMGVSRQ